MRDPRLWLSVFGSSPTGVTGQPASHQRTEPGPEVGRVPTLGGGSVRGCAYRRAAKAEGQEGARASSQGDGTGGQACNLTGM